MMRRLIITLAFLFSLLVMLADNPVPTDSLTKELQEIVVNYQQPTTRVEGTTLITTVAGTPMQNLGTALDVLGQIPMVKVEDDAVSIVGRGTPEIYINGRPMHSDDELLQLPSSNISKIELLMAPGALYGIETRAVLKISTRRNLMEGLSILDRADVRMRRVVSANDFLDVSYRLRGWEFFASGSIARNNSLIKGYTVNTLMYDGQPTEIGSSQKNRYPSLNGVVKAGVNYSYGALSVGGYYRYNPERGDFRNDGSEWFGSTPEIIRRITSDTRAHSHLGSVYFDDLYAGKYHLHFDGDFRISNSRKNDATRYDDAIYPEVSSESLGKSRLFAGKLYLTFPLAKGEFTAGIQDSYTSSSLDYRMDNLEVGLYIPSALSESRQTSTAAFASWARTFGPLQLSAGARYEYVDYSFRVDGVEDPDVSRHDHTITPDISLSYSFSETADLSLSYRMATMRPPYSNLTGSLTYTGLHEIEGGNPALRDERMHDIGLFGVWNGFILQADLIRSLDSYGFVKRLYPAPDLQLIMQPINLNMTTADIYVGWQKSIRAWNPSFTAGVHRQWLEIEGTKYNRPIFSYYLSNLITLPCDFSVSVTAYGSSEGDMSTNRFGATWCCVDASVSKFLLGNSLQLKLAATDLLNTYNSSWSMNTYGVDVRKYQSYDNRGVSLTVTYHFHPRKSAYKGSSASEEELNRL